MQKALLFLLTIAIFSGLAIGESHETSRDLALDDTSLFTDQEGSIDSGKPNYNNFALNCMDDRGRTENCMKEPYKYYCDSEGKMRYTKKETAVCVWCECIDLFPKPACIINLIGQANCARSLSNETDWRAMDSFDRAQAVKKEQLRIAESTEAKPANMPAGLAHRTSSASRPGVPMWIKKLSTGFNVFASFAAPNSNQAKACIVSDNPMDSSCGFNKRGSVGKKRGKIMD